MAPTLERWDRSKGRSWTRPGRIPCDAMEKGMQDMQAIPTILVGRRELQQQGCNHRVAACQVLHKSRQVSREAGRVTQVGFLAHHSRQGRPHSYLPCLHLVEPSAVKCQPIGPSWLPIWVGGTLGRQLVERTDNPWLGVGNSVSRDALAHRVMAKRAKLNAKLRTLEASHGDGII